MGSKTRAFFKRWVSPPFYKGDEIRTVRARLLNSTTISTLSFLALLLIGNSLGGRIPASVMLLDFSMIAVVTLVHVLLRRGMIAFAGIALTTLGFVFITVVNIRLGTIRTPTAGIYLFLIILTGIIFGNRGILVSAIASSLAIAGLILAENAGILPKPDYAVTVTQWISYTALFGLTAAMIFYAIQATNKALVRAEKEIKERRQAEAELRKLSRAVEQSPASIVIADLDGKMEYVNPRFTLVTGYSYDEAIGKNPRILKTDQTPPETHRLLWETLTTGKEWHGEFVNRKKDGSTYHELASISPIMDTRGVTTQYLAVKEDITERKRSEEELRRSFRENQALLRELQHRAKNSFNMISGMIHIASGEGGSSETLEVLDQLNARVLSVAELYSLLYSTGSFTEVRLDEYCGKLASALIGLRPDISLVTDMEAVVVTANRAAPIGLIATELITNSLKYAFPGGRRGRVTVSLRNGPDRAVLAVRDDGVGLPAGFDHSGSAGMGIKLVRGLANQVGGSFAIAGGEGGTSCSLEFAAEGA